MNRPLCFVLMPFGKKPATAGSVVNFDAVYKELIVPAIEAGKTVVREVDVQGFQSIRIHPLFLRPGGRYPLFAIFILPEDTRQLLAHIRTRAPMSGEELERRLRSAKSELAVAPETDVQIRNADGKLEETVTAVEQAIESSK